MLQSIFLVTAGVVAVALSQPLPALAIVIAFRGDGDPTAGVRRRLPDKAYGK